MIKSHFYKLKPGQSVKAGRSNQDAHFFTVEARFFRIHYSFVATVYFTTSSLSERLYFNFVASPPRKWRIDL
ncbi:hypothetical protein J2S21_001578 [Peribacillus cavernae]|nr:hypothetical protein [Peribacillus cavernae]